MVARRRSGGRCSVSVAFDDIRRFASSCVSRRGRSGIFEIGSRLVVAAAFPLALGISADVAVVTYKITERSAISLMIAGGAAMVFLAVWYVYPLVARERRKLRSLHQVEHTLRGLTQGGDA